MDGIELPVTRYALSGDVSIAYQVMGDGPVDIILIPGFMSHIEFQHELAGWTAFLRRLSKFARVVTFDKRGPGLSDRISDAPSLEQREIEIRGRDIGGVAVHAAARVMALSQPDEVLVSRVVTDLVAGAGLKFSERGPHELKGLPGRWDLFAASA
jgi:pimeloyl-ACP methyl ester carboxylesterase